MKIKTFDRPFSDEVDDIEGFILFIISDIHGQILQCEFVSYSRYSTLYFMVLYVLRLAVVLLTKLFCV